MWGRRDSASGATIVRITLNTPTAHTHTLLRVLSFLIQDVCVNLERGDSLALLGHNSFMAQEVRLQRIGFYICFPSLPECLVDRDSSRDDAISGDSCCRILFQALDVVFRLRGKCRDDKLSRKPSCASFAARFSDSWSLPKWLLALAWGLARRKK